MKIVMFSINPLFPDRVIGGSTKHLKNIATHLGILGHDVTVLCTQRDDTVPFNWHPRVSVEPRLKFKQPYPQPYDLPAYKMAANIQDLAELLVGADRFYMHDGEFLFPSVYHHIPTVISLRDNVYPETMLGSFLFQADRLIAIAEYSRQIYLNTAGRFIPELAERTITINNGIDWEQFTKKDPDPAIFEIIPVDSARHTVILHPHRPEVSKGLDQTVKVVDLLVHTHNISNIKTLVPRWFDADATPEVSAYYREIMAEIEQRGLSDNFIFHDWIPHRLMPDYYNLGSVMLALGHFVEAFGNTVYESLGCGTPAVAARIATHRSLLPDALLDKVHYGDVETAADLAARIIKRKESTSPETLAYLHAHYAVREQLAAYAAAILGASKLPPVSYRFETLDEATTYRLAPWCYQWHEGRFYHDYLANHRQMAALSACLAHFPGGFSKVQASSIHLASPAQVEKWYRQGYLVPVIA
jgi:glycosyltransferase involved in cell wall biosynthesis